MIKAQELRDMQAAELRTKIGEMEESLFDQRLQASMGKLQNVTVLRTLKRDIARAKTVLTEKAATASSPEATKAEEAKA